MKRFLIGLFSILVIAGLAGYAAKPLLTKKVAQKITTDPSVQSAVNTAMQNPVVQSQIKQYIAKYGTSELHFSSQQQAIDYALNHVSPSEAAKLYNLYQNRDALTPAEQLQAEKEITADFTPQQLAAMAQVFENQGNGAK